MVKVLACFNCKFKKSLKNELAAPVIIRNHNENRDRWDHHIMHLMEEEELKSVNSLPYYDGMVYRGVCICNTILDRKTKRGLDYAMAMHIITGEETNRLRYSKGERELEHGFEDREVDRKGQVIDTNPRTFRIKRSDYIAKNPTEEIRLQEHMARYNIKEDQLSESTELATFDQNLFWIGTRSFSFNGINGMLFQHFRVYNCSRCGKYSWDGRTHANNEPTAKTLEEWKQFPTFKELYWHYYREHYLNAGTTNESEYYTELKQELENGYCWGHREKEIREQLEIAELAAKSGIKVHDTAISMLQQLVLVETAFKKRKQFNYDRSSNALYQLNRIHGISLDDLRQLFYPTSTGRGTVGDKLFHGMVWTENKAPDWLDAVVQTLGEEMQI